MEQTSERLELRREIAIAARPETVWELLVDPDRAITWWGREMALDPRPGGALRIAVTARSVASGEFVELDPPRRLVFTWGWESGGGDPGLVPPGSTTVEIDLVPDGDGTLVRLVHRDLPTEESAGAHGEGWTHYLGRLAVVAEGGEPGPDPWAAEPPAA
jgi:uncharacterized protein YndB with AHSA1/START domain